MIRGRMIAKSLAALSFAGVCLVVLTTHRAPRGVSVLGQRVKACLFDYKDEHGFFPEDLRDTLPILQRSVPQCAVSITHTGGNRYAVTLECPRRKSRIEVEYILKADGDLEVINVLP